MADQDAYQRILASVYDAMLDDARWPATSALIDEACGLTGNALAVAEDQTNGIRVRFFGLYQRGRRREDLERWYLEDYHSTDERIPRMRQRPYGRVLYVKRDQYTVDELKHSRAYNECLVPALYGDSLAVTLEGLPCDGVSHIGFSMGDPATSNGWGSSQIKMLTRLFPHIRQFVLVRRALERTEALGSTLTGLLDNPRVGVLHLDRRGRILAANDPARRILQDHDGLSDRNGVLRAEGPDDERRLQHLMAAALPTSSIVPVSGSMLLRRCSVALPFVLHVKPVSVPQPDLGARHVAALALVVEPGRQHPVEPALVAKTLGLTPAESRVAVWLAEGKSVREMAEATGHKRGTISWHLKQIYQKLPVRRQADLVRVVLSIAELG
ncbi:MAG: LuxR C-terminal-related transcriptional regulator [Acidobacteria bacterium]|nr:LuxR C-terminal-related transcriptional regulator [Acidobacteriota bacterium]